MTDQADPTGPQQPHPAASTPAPPTTPAPAPAPAQPSPQASTAQPSLQAPPPPYGGPGAPHPGEPSFPGGRGPTPMTPADETTWSTVGHLSWLAGSLVALPFLAPLVLWLVLRERGPFVRHHLTEAVNFQLSLLVYGLAVGVVGGLATLITVGLLAPVWALVGGALVVVGIVFTVLAAIAASRGQWYRYPLTIRFVR